MKAILSTNRNAIYHRVRKLLGSVKKHSCKDCGRPAEEYDHPNGYDEENWKKVEPVCRKCHKRRESTRGTLRRLKKGLFGPPCEDGEFLSIWARNQQAQKRQRERAFLNFVGQFHGPRMENGKFYSDQRA